MSEPKFDKKEYTEFIQQSVENGSFFKDSFDWYIFRYVSPFCDRTWLFFTTAASAVITYILSIMIANSFPIVQKIPVVIAAKDTVKYTPRITNLKDSKDVKTIEEAIIKYLVVRYVKKREEYDFSQMTTSQLNDKFDVVKNNSTPGEFRRFKAFVSLNNPNSPIKDFGKNIKRSIKVTDFSFKREVNEDFFSKAKNFVYIQLPTQADISYTMTISSGDIKITKDYVSRVSFKFSKINNNDVDEDIDFSVSNYEQYIRRKTSKE